MDIIKRNYFPLYKDFGTILENFLKNQEDTSYVATGMWAPSVDIKEEKNQFVVVADIPGVNKEDIQITLENNLLTIQGERVFEKTDEDKNGYTRVERSQGQFYRRFSLPQTADDANISANYKQGVLKICIPKKQAALEKKINIEVEE